LHWQTNFDKLIKTIEVENNAVTDVMETRLREAMDVAPPPPPRSRAPLPTPAAPQKLSGEMVESTLSRMLNQLDMLVKTAAMMDQRAAMLEDKLVVLQNGKPPPKSRR
jgi:hypothetical protein